MNKLDSAMAKTEAGKSQTKIGDVRQLRKVFEEICASEIVSKMLATGEVSPDLQHSRTLRGVESRIYSRAARAIAQARKAGK